MIIMEQLVNEIMSTNIVSVNADDTLRTIRGIFNRVKFHHLLVLEGKKLLGVISDRDYLKAVSRNVGTQDESLSDQQTLEITAEETMSRDVVAVNGDIKLDTAAQLMLYKGISCLPVADENFNVLGIITLKEILRFYIKQDQVSEASFVSYIRKHNRN